MIAIISEPKNTNKKMTGKENKKLIKENVKKFNLLNPLAYANTSGITMNETLALRYDLVFFNTDTVFIIFSKYLSPASIFITLCP